MSLPPNNEDPVAPVSLTDDESATNFESGNNINLPGSSLNPFKLLIIGGGPASISIIIRAIRLGVLKDLCKNSKSLDPRAHGICIIDKDSSKRFGGGRLQDYEVLFL